VRFADSVFPGETLITRMWKESDTRVIVETSVKERDFGGDPQCRRRAACRIPQVKAKPVATGGDRGIRARR
jgi:hypothetical protein